MFSIIRPVNLLLLFAVQFTLWYRLCSQNINESGLTDFILLCCSVICVAAGGYIFNDIIDIETDRINKFRKVFIDRYISRKGAFILYFSLNIVALVLAISLWHFNIILITLSAILLLYFYSKRFKGTVLFGNLIVAILSILPIIEIYLYFDSKNAEFEFLAYTIFAFLTTLLREIVKDREDTEGDLKSGIKTLANSISESKLKLILLVINCSLLTSLITFPICLKNFNILSFGAYFVLMISPALIIFALIYKLKQKNSYSFLSLFIKIYMFLGLIRLWI